jgi:hypothetical protein
VIRLLAVVSGAFALWAAPAEAATWCGTPSAADREPQVVAGHNIHAVYAIASDGPDNTPTVAQALQTDAEAIDAWWRAQDATRSPRFDMFQFPCGPQLDLTVLRLSRTTAQLRAHDGRFESIWNAVVNAGFDTRFVKYLIYYDGPVDLDICGEASGSDDGAGIAIVYTVACAGAPLQTTAAHELIHSFGALTRSGPPHTCGDSASHPCDSEQDILFPRATPNELSWYMLDVGHDDYYGHSGGWLDVQDSPWLRRLDGQARLTLQLSGGGTIESDIPGPACSATCAIDWNPGTVLGLTATAAPGQRFVRWGGGCSGTTPCTLRIERAATVTALFAPATFRLSVARVGRGTVRSSGGEIVCPGRCASAATSHAPLRLRAVPAKGWRFARWSGGCGGTRSTCTLPMTKASTARATFVRPRR